MFDSRNRNRRGLAITLIACIAILACGLFLLNGIDSASAGAEEALVQEAVRRAMITCYAVEGAYPPDVNYLMENYGLAYNDEEYFVSYQAFASNVLPEIHVTRKGAEV